MSRVGTRLVVLSAAGKLPQLFQFSVLPTTKVRNAFIMPGGQVFVTRALLEQLNSEGELAAVLSHEIAHVLIEDANGKAPGLGTAFGDGLPAALDAAPGSLAALEASRQNELTADFLGMCILSQTGYDPADMTKVVQVFLEAAQTEARPPEYLSTHPDPALRLEKIQEHLANLESCSGGQLPAPISQ